MKTGVLDTAQANGDDAGDFTRDGIITRDEIAAQGPRCELWFETVKTGVLDTARANGDDAGDFTRDGMAA